MRCSSPKSECVLALSALLALCACGDSDSHVPPRATGAPPAAVTPSPSAPAPSTRRDTPRTPPPRTTLGPLREALAEGRRLSRAGQHPAALAAFERALALDPSSPRLRCEAGYVAYLAGDLSRAERYVTSSLQAFLAANVVPETQRQATAMCLFNAGLVYEARERASEAIDAWRRSLALRENATVRARLQALTGGRDPSGAARTRGGARERALADVCGTFDDGQGQRCRLRRFESEASNDTLVTMSERTPSGAAPEGFTARIATARGDLAFGTATVAYLEASYGGTTLVDAVGRAWEPGVGGVSGELEIRRFEWLDVVPGGRAELVVEMYEFNNDEDMGVCSRSGGTTRTLVICGSDTGRLACTSIDAEATTYVEEYDGCEEDGVTPHETRTGHSLAYTLANGELRLTREPDSPVELPSTMPRARPVSSWLADPAFAWPRAASP